MELEIQRAIVKYGMEDLYEYSEVDVLIVGAGPSGLTCAKYLAEKGYKVAVYEKRLSFGGGIGGGGNMIPKIVVQEEVLPIVEDFKIKCQKADKGLYVVDPAELIAKLATGALDAGAKFFLGVYVEDVIVRDNPPKVCGVLWKWTAIEMAGLHVDPLFTSSKALVDASGHGAEIVQIAAEKNPDLNIFIKGERSNWSEVSERLVVEHTGKVAEGLYVTGIAVCEIFGLPRMGPIFGGMLMSGKKIAEVIAADLSKKT
ncbi:MAG: Putative thiazole biosynthetic enzyme [Thermodesulfobacterium sp. 37_54]|uniref:Thiamine thiazole synthase n=1 Tax=Thermodesulfobacterium commune TaxID=1741 RepID=A0A101FKH6_9BACT|nr:MAG: Putative thiazole biosynthetic enzyme [Thermodesulfobacterium sp. 37_54]KUK19888.1 MAG: Putative thiazole biosynthetic enzyme [Thermodesulfobacterium commune]KUK38686.1 MAG: Putative thiazole biosynthetic enzyme [Thermodesulfobacterium commune]HAA84580.1 ribose 1,5-bisphosphate isomerase [Thermodesulfobacterium commune]HBT03776.1 ribose 1,5-bisphosphate isomerase [Thermodesulfobacterium commune]